MGRIAHFSLYWEPLRNMGEFVCFASQNPSTSVSYLFELGLVILVSDH